MKASPDEVRRSISADFKRRGITYEIAAKQLGFKNKQTVANIVSRKKREYLSAEQANRFHFTFDYSVNYLTKGVGELYEREQDPLDGLIDINPPFAGLSPEVLVIIINVAECIIHACGKQAANDAWTCIMNGDFRGFQEHIAHLADWTQPYTSIPALTHYVCEKMKENNNESYRSTFIHGL